MSATSQSKSASVQWAGDSWRVVALGVEREDGKVYAHLASTTRSIHQRNGSRAIQIADWLPKELLS